MTTLGDPIAAAGCTTPGVPTGASVRGAQTPRVPADLVPLREVPEHRPWVTLRYLRKQRAERRLPVWKLGSRLLLVSLADVDALPQHEPARRGPLAGAR